MTDFPEFMKNEKIRLTVVSKTRKILKAIILKGKTEVKLRIGHILQTENQKRMFMNLMSILFVLQVNI